MVELPRSLMHDVEVLDGESPQFVVESVSWNDDGIQRRCQSLNALELEAFLRTISRSSRAYVEIRKDPDLYPCLTIGSRIGLAVVQGFFSEGTMGVLKSDAGDEGGRGPAKVPVMDDLIEYSDHFVMVAESAWRKASDFARDISLERLGSWEIL